MKLPQIDGCPGCSKQAEELYRFTEGNRPMTHRQAPGRFDQSTNRPIPEQISVHQRLGPINEYNAGEFKEEGQWCPSGIFTKTQKRRVQRLRCREINNTFQRHDDKRPKTKKVWKPKVKTQVQVPEASVNMVFMLPKEFCTMSIEDASEEESAKLVLDPQQAIFEKPDLDYLHLKALYVSGFVNGKPISKMLIDGGAAVNVMPMATFKKIGKTPEELVKTNMTLRGYEGKSSEVRGVTNVEVTIGSKTLPTTFFVIDGKGSYAVLLGRDWIHANCCVPSTMHQFLIQWIGDTVEIVQGDRSVSVASADFLPLSVEGFPCLSGTYWEGDMLEITEDGVQITGGETPRLL